VGAKGQLGVALALGLALTAGCLEPQHVSCADGRLCPQGTACDDLHQRCVDPAQLIECDDKDDSDPCEIGGLPVGVCNDGVCLRAGCGDFFITGFEQCDGTTFPPEIDNCDDVGFHEPGPLGCLPDCRYDTSACAGFCGDGVIDDQEDCEPSDLGGASCLDFGFYSEAGLDCTSVCTFDISGCSDSCGDGVRNGEEECDGDDLDQTSCRDLGFYDQPGLACNSRCLFDTDGCTGYCGDGDVRASEGEVCDGAPPTEGSCTDFGFDLGRLGCSAFCTPGFDACDHNGFTSLPRPPPAWYRDIWSTDGVELFVVGQQPGIIARFDGDRWQTMTTPTAEWMFGLWGTSRSNLYASGDNGVILRYDGATWTQEASGVGAPMFDLWGSGPTDIFAVGDSSTITHYDGGGWTPQSVPGNATLYGVWGRAPDDVYAVGSGGEILHYDGGGWTNESSPTTSDLHAVFGVADGPIYAAGVGGTILRRDATGWTEMDSPTNRWLSSLWANGPHDVYAGGGDGMVLRYDGRSWEMLVTGTSSWVDAMWGDGTAGNLIAIGEGSLVSRFHGRAWHLRTSVAGPTTYDVWAEQYPYVFAVGANGLVMRHDPVTHSSVSFTPSFGSLHGVWGSAPDDVYAVGTTVQHWDGSSWSEVTVPGTPTFNGIWGSDPTNIYAVGESGAVYRYNGSSWSNLNIGAIGRLTSVGGSGRGDVWITGLFGVLHHFDGASWTSPTSPTGLDIHTVLSRGPDDVYIGGSAGIHHWDGSSWTQQLLPSPGVIRGLWSSAPDDLFAVGDGGLLLHFDGQSWSRIDSETPVSLHAVGGTPGHLLLAGADARLYHFARIVPWRCSASEQSCGDGRDDDCDGLLDLRDDDCAGAVRLSEVRGGGGTTTAYIELTNRGASHTNLAGLTLGFRSACDDTGHTMAFGGNAVAPPGTSFRAVDAADDVGPREVYLQQSWCHRPDDSAWVALCDGPCDEVSCSNLVDYVELSGSGTVTALACASSTPGPVDVSGAGNGDSTGRAAYAGYRETGVAADWTVGPATRD
jgi:hypothetical protein